MKATQYREELYYQKLVLHIRSRITAAAEKKLDVQRTALEEEARALSVMSTSMAKQGILIPVEYLCRSFSCTEFERLCILTAFAIELQPELKESFQNQYPVLAQCIHMFTDSFAEELRILKECYGRKKILGQLMKEKAPKSAAWQEWRMQLDQRIVDFCLGNVSEPESGIGYMEIYLPGAQKTETLFFHERERDRVCEILQSENRTGVFFIRGERGCGKKFWIKAIADKLKLPLILIDTGELSANKEEFQKQLHYIWRESLLQGGMMIFFHLEALIRREDNSCLNILLEKISGYSQPVFLLSEETLKSEKQRIRQMLFEISFRPLNYQERLTFWNYLCRNDRISQELLRALAVRFAFTQGQIYESVKEIRERSLMEDTDSPGEDMVYEICQKQIHANMDEIAVPMRGSRTFEDLVLPPQAMERLHQAISQIQYQDYIYEEWGFDQKVIYGRGISMLFYGPPGTGKTMAAGVIAGKLHMELYKIDLSAVMSKYIGETEKNLKKVFDAVKGTRNILFFDEADALFGKRSEVSDAQDKYANAETAYLLQKMEEYEGVIILATNFLQNFDRAFLRRIKFLLEFPFPQEEERHLIWRRIFPGQTPVDSDIDYPFLAKQFELTGSGIKNAAVSAAFLAAEQKCKVSMKHLITAIKIEIEKSGRIMDISDFGRYGYLIAK